MVWNRKAIEYDLITQTGYELRDVGQTLSWSALASFISYMPESSAILRKHQADVYEWSTQTKTNVILADIYDMLAAINANIVAIGSHHKAETPKPYPRPGIYQRDGGNTKRIGKGALPRGEFKKWLEKKRREYKR